MQNMIFFFFLFRNSGCYSLSLFIVVLNTRVWILQDFYFSIEKYDVILAVSANIWVIEAVSALLGVS